MSIVTEYDWQSDTWTHHNDNGARAAWRAAVAEIAAKAHEKLPGCNGRIDSAVKLVIADDVDLMADGTAKVASQSNGTTVYHIVNGHCDCKDFPKAPHGFCKHRLSAAIARRAQELLTAKLNTPASSQPEQTQPTPAPLPEAPASVNVHLAIHGRQVQLTLRDTDENRLLARLDVILQRFPATDKPADETPQCPRHGVPLKLNQGKDGRSWWSHKTAEGWCKGK